MKKLVLILAVLNLVGCSESPKQVAAPAQRASDLPIASIDVTTIVDGHSVLVPIYADDKASVPLANPIVTSGDGKFSFYLAGPGIYKFTPHFGKDAEAGAHSETSGKPDSEKPEKK